MASVILAFPDCSEDVLYVKKERKDGFKYCGYKLEYLSQNLTEMEQRLVICKVCSGVMRYATIWQGETTCFVCSSSLGVLNSVKDVQSSVAILKVKCPLLRDCNWKGQLWEAEKHLKTCVSYLIECAKCKQVLQRGQKEEHESKSCPLRTIECSFCDKVGPFPQVDKHLEVCLGFMISCPNGCGERLPRIAVPRHKTRCELEEISCPYTEYGCKANSMLRRDLLAHKKEFIVEHTDLGLVKIKQLEKVNIILKKKQIELKYPLSNLGLDGGIDWEIKSEDRTGFLTFAEGPATYLNKYRIRVFVRYGYYGFASLMLRFAVKRIEGKFDSDLGEAYITTFRIICVNKYNFMRSKVLTGSIGYQLKIGDEYGLLPQTPWPSTEDKSMLVRFYFTIFIRKEPGLKPLRLGTTVGPTDPMERRLGLYTGTVFI